MAVFERPYEDAIAVFDNAIDSAEQALAERGLLMAPRPADRGGTMTDRPELPPNLAECSWAELQELLGIFTAWFVYANDQLQLATGKRNSADDQKTFTWAKIRRSKEGTVSDKDDATRCDSRYQDAQAKYEHYDTMVRMLTGMVKGLDREIDTISRAVTVMELRQGVEGKGVGARRKAQQHEVKTRGHVKQRDVLASFRAGQRRGR
jgi:hypothetical protein